MAWTSSRRDLLTSAPALALALALGAGRAWAQAAKDTLAIAVPTDVNSWDAEAHTQPLGMPIFKAVFDQPLTQTPDLKLAPNVIQAWRWLDDAGKALAVTLRDDVLWHTGDKLTTEDFRFTYIDRLRADKTLNIAGTFNSTLDDIEIKSPTEAVVHFKQVMPTVLQWWAFLGNFLMPKAYFEKVGKDGFLAKPVGSGPYRLVEYERGARIVLEANDRYWKGAPKIRRVIFQIVPDPSARVAAVQAGQVDMAVAVPIREAARLGKVQGLASVIEPISEIVMIHCRNAGAFTDQRVRVAANLAIDKAALSKALFEGKAKPISVLSVPGAPGYPADFQWGYDPKKAADLLAQAGYGPDKPAKIGFFATNGAFPNDWDTARAITAMWKKVGIDANLEVMELAKYFELDHSGQLPEATLYTWANATNDPEIYVGYILNPKLKFAAWKSDDVAQKLDPLFKEPNYDKRIAGYTELNRYVIEKGYSIPVLQEVGTLVHRAGLNLTWFQSGWFEVAGMSWAS